MTPKTIQTFLAVPFVVASLEYAKEPWSGFSHGLPIGLQRGVSTYDIPLPRSPFPWPINRYDLHSEASQEQPWESSLFQATGSLSNGTSSSNYFAGWKIYVDPSPVSAPQVVQSHPSVLTVNARFENRAADVSQPWRVGHNWREGIVRSDQYDWHARLNRHALSQRPRYYPRSVMPST